MRMRRISHMVRKKRGIGKRGKYGVTRKKILLLMAEADKKMEFQEIRNALGMAKSTIHVHLNALKNDGLIKEFGSGWELTAVSRPPNNPSSDSEWFQKWTRYTAWTNRWICSPMTSKGEEFFKLPGGKLRIDIWTESEMRRLDKCMWYRKNVVANGEKLRFDHVFMNALNKFQRTMIDENPKLWNELVLTIEKNEDFTWYIKPTGTNRQLKKGW